MLYLKQRAPTLLFSYTNSSFAHTIFAQIHTKKGKSTVKKDMFPGIHHQRLEAF